MKKLFSLICVLLVFVTALYCEIRYIEIDSIKNVPVIEIKNIEDFEAIINEYGVRIGYLQKSIDSTKTGRNIYDGLTLYIIAESVYFSFPMKGYLTLTDYKNGITKKFENGSDYNRAVSLGFDSSKVYYYYTRNSFSSVEDCMDAFNNGFVDTRKNDYGSRTDDSTAYYNAKKLGYSNYSDYSEYIEYTNKGFNNKADWQIAKAKGFNKGRDYYNATENGFFDYQSFNAAQGLGLSNNEDYQKYNLIIASIERIMKERNLEKKNAIIYYYIQNLQKGEMAISALVSSMEELYNTQSENLSKAMDFWYSNMKYQDGSAYKNDSRFANTKIMKIKTLFSQQSLVDFLSTEDISGLGTFNTKTEIFKRK